MTVDMHMVKKKAYNQFNSNGYKNYHWYIKHVRACGVQALINNNDHAEFFLQYDQGKIYKQDSRINYNGDYIIVGDGERIPKRKDYFNYKINENDIIGIHLNTHTSTLSFSCNDKNDYGVAFYDIPHGNNVVYRLIVEPFAYDCEIGEIICNNDNDGNNNEEMKEQKEGQEIEIIDDTKSLNYQTYEDEKTDYTEKKRERRNTSRRGRRRSTN